MTRAGERGRRQALGHDGPLPRPLGADPRRLKDHLRGDDPRIPGADAMIKTTRRAAGRGWSTWIRT